MPPQRPLDDEVNPKSSWADDPVYHAFRVYISFLQEIFSTLDGDLLKWRFSYDPEETKVNISGPPPIDARQVANRPAIIVDLPSVNPAGSSIGDMAGLNVFTGTKKYIDYFMGAFPVYVIVDNKRSAVTLSWLVHQMTWTLRDSLIGNGRFHNIGRTQIGPPSPPGSLVSGDPRGPLVTIPMLVPFVFAYKSSVRIVNQPQLERVEFHIRPQNPTTIRETHVPNGWTVEAWIAQYNAGKGYTVPLDPHEIPELPTETPDAQQSGSEVLVNVDLIK